MSAGHGASQVPATKAQAVLPHPGEDMDGEGHASQADAPAAALMEPAAHSAQAEAPGAA